MQLPRDEDLMLAVGRGDREAFAVLLARHQTRAWNIAYRFVGNREDAADLVQDAFLKLLAAAPRYRPTAAFQTWFTCILSRLCLDFLQKKRPVSCDELPECEAPDPLPEGRMLTAERAQNVRRALATLPPNQRLVIILRYYEECGYREMAEALDISEKAVERLLARARTALGSALKDWA